MIVVLCLTLILAGVIILTLQRRMLAAVRRKAEQLREAINFTEAVISHAGEGIVVYDREMKFKMLNKLMAESLAVCRKIAERHGGTITAKSQPQQGTTFIVALPAHQSKSDRLN